MKLKLLIMQCIIFVGINAMEEDKTGRESSLSSLAAQPPTPTLTIPVPQTSDRKKTARDAVVFFESHLKAGDHKTQNCNCDEYRKEVNKIVLNKPPFMIFGKLKVPRLVDPLGTKFRTWAAKNGWYEGITRNDN
ncbi:MAG: hypothetical protein BWY54_00784 [Candidatus Dependentiae bacterium ADurb.Bin331]|nr:MAG: hypothetical protein BWY54_00784 [Candidatus Dependentiae bacterium ADurb.Bin331]